MSGDVDGALARPDNAGMERVDDEVVPDGDVTGLRLAVADLPLSSLRVPPPDLWHQGEHAVWAPGRAGSSLAVL